MSIDFILGGLGLIATLVGVYLGWGPWKEHRRKKRFDDGAVLTKLAETIINNYKNVPVSRYPYAEVKGAIGLNCVVNNDVHSRTLIDELMRNGAPGEQRKPALVIGEYGQGKTIACGALAYNLASSFLKNPATGRLPILVSLREHPDLRLLDQVALGSIRRLHNVDLDPNVYSRARVSGRLVFILDGLDELLSRADSGTVREHLDTLRSDAAFLTNQLVVTSRPNVFEIIDVTYLKDAFDWVTIQLPTLKQVYGYLSSRGLLDFVGVIQRADAELLQGLIRRPLFLDMIAASAASLASIQSAQDITESKIYDQYFNSWYLRELPKMGATIKNLTIDQVDRILSSAAHQMTSKNTGFITEDEFVAIVQQEAQSNPRQDLDTLERQATNRLLLVPEFSAGGKRRFTFRHDSLRSYFSARYLYQAFLRDPTAFTATATFDSVSLLFFLAIVKTEQAAHSTLSALYQADLQNRSYRRDLLGVVLLYWAIASKTLDVAYLRDFCANAEEPIRSLLLGNLGNLDLSGLDLSGLNLANGVFRNGKLNGAILRTTDLRNAVMDGAKLIRVTLDQTSVAGTSFKLADLTEAIVSDVIESGADFERACFKKAVMTRCTFSQSRFTRTDLTEATIKSCTFQDSALVSGTLDNCVLERCRWKTCDVNGASFRGASLSSCEFADTNIGEAVGLPPTGWTDGRLIG
jgi:uncharacterized protein YjbI with pentapeptide repeats